MASLPSDTAAQHWSSAQRLQALFESHALSGVALHAWCREKGLFEHQLKQWRETFCSTTEPERRESRDELRELKVKNEQLQRDLRRKDRALAETAALLVLAKKSSRRCWRTRLQQRLGSGWLHCCNAQVLPHAVTYPGGLPG